MGKHDIKDKVIAASSEEFTANRIRDLEKRLAFAAESNAKLIKENAKWQRWFNERTTELEEQIEKRDARIRNLQMALSRAAEDVYGV